ncbi:MAG: FIST C-terminal domain-containing protein [Synergistaceae bacterium]|jgi:hypothetical protein|nr:FIST C-terminal domain-containing protein [Synergistaceae bacterium]
MIRMLSAFTDASDPSAAAAEIFDAIDPEQHLLGNSLGIMHCRPEYAAGGAVKAVCGRFGFDTVGSVSPAFSASTAAYPSGESSDTGMLYTVLTSDDVRFTTVQSARISPARLSGALDDMYQSLMSSVSERPRLIVPFAPFMRSVNGDDVVMKLDSLVGDIPMFGALGFSNDADAGRSYAIYNGAVYPGAMTLTAFTGNVEPDMFSITTLKETMLKLKAVITKAEDNRLIEVNGTPAKEFFASIGLLDDGGGIEQLKVKPMLLETPDGRKLARNCVGISSDGDLLCAGYMPVGAKLEFAVMRPDDVVKSTRVTLEEALKSVLGRGGAEYDAEEAEGKCVLIYSCVARMWQLCGNDGAERELVKSIFSASAQYNFVYCGGEIFPQHLPNGRTVSALQNNTLIACVL